MAVPMRRWAGAPIDASVTSSVQFRDAGDDCGCMACDNASATDMVKTFMGEFLGESLPPNTAKAAMNGTIVAHRAPLYHQYIKKGEEDNMMDMLKSGDEIV